MQYIAGKKDVNKCLKKNFVNCLDTLKKADQTLSKQVFLKFNYCLFTRAPANKDAKDSKPSMGPGPHKNRSRAAGRSCLS